MTRKERILIIAAPIYAELVKRDGGHEFSWTSAAKEALWKARWFVDVQDGKKPTDRP